MSTVTVMIHQDIKGLVLTSRFTVKLQIWNKKGEKSSYKKHLEENQGHFNLMKYVNDLKPNSLNFLKDNENLICPLLFSTSVQV